MESEKLNKKQLVPLVVGVLTLVLLVFGATYAYFSVSIGNTSNKTTITGDIGGGTLGTITLDGGNAELYLGISAYDMSETNKGTVYYSSTTEGSRETNVNSAGKTTYTATLSGDETDSVMYACDYEFTVTSSGTLLNASSKDDVELVFNGDINKTLTLTGSDKVSGTWYGFKNSNKEREFNAYLEIANTDSNQNSLAGTNLSVEIENTKWKCYLSELDELVGEAYAIVTQNKYDENYEEYVYNLTFIRSETPIKVGDTYNSKTIEAVYTGFETEIYDIIKDDWGEVSDSDIPWLKTEYRIVNVNIEDEIRPISTAYWFYNAGAYGDDYNTWYSGYVGTVTLNLEKLNTSLVTDMSHMFDCGFIAYPFRMLEIYGLENWNTSKVTDMSNMFDGPDSDGMLNNLNLSEWDVSNVTDMSWMFAKNDTETVGDLSNWDVSNVTNMEGMFSMFYGESIGDLSSWDVSKVTNMSYMFDSTIFTNIGDISNWDVSNVTNMSYMFGYALVLTNVEDISGWNVSKVTNMESMFFGVTINRNLGINEWDVSNVTNMNNMFGGSTINTDLNLIGWNVSNVTNHDYFNDSISGTGTLTPPIWPTN